MILPKRISKSSINMFRSCPLKWYFQENKFLEIKTDDTAREYGKIIHAVIANYLVKIDDYPKESEVIEKLDLALVETGGWRLDNDKPKTKKIRDNIIAFEKERIKRKEKKPVLIEKKYYAKLFSDLPEFVIIVDAYMEGGKVIDWKTGSMSEVYEGERVQGKIYEMVLEANHIPVKEITFHFLQSGMSETLPKISEGYIYERAKEMCDMIEKDRFPKRPNNFCNNCPFILRCQFRSECPWCI